MLKWLATVHKEWLLLIRDRTGLLLLFAMPAALVVVITLVQQNIMRQTGGLRMSGVVVNQDGGEAALILMRELAAAETVSFQDRPSGHPADEAQARRMIEKGSVQFYVLLPAELTTQVTGRVRGRVERQMTGEQADGPPPSEPPQLSIHFDPAVQGIYRSAVNGAVQRALAVMQAEYSMRFLGEAIETRVRSSLSQTAGAFAPQLPERLLPELRGDLLKDPVAGVDIQSAGPARHRHLPTAVQQNVPAWALFGMFFIVVPLSGSLIRERRDGILARLMTMPVAKAALILGKLSAYVGVCLVQFACVVAVGIWVLPLLGGDRLAIGHPWGMLVVALCSALAATGYGIMLGSLARTNEQAAVLGPVSVVVAAALGGIMVPVFAMPHTMQVISRGSPLAWAQEAFLALLVRGEPLAQVAVQLSLLLLFFAATFAAALMGFNRRGSLN